MDSATTATTPHAVTGTVVRLAGTGAVVRAVSMAMVVPPRTTRTVV